MARRSRGPSAPAIASLVLLVLLGAAVAVLVTQLRDRDETTTDATPTTTSSQPSITQTMTGTMPQPSRLLVYFVRDGRMGAASRSVAATKAVGRAALDALLQGPTPDEEAAGLTTQLPNTITIESLTIENGHATVQLAEDVTQLGRAQLVFTLTQFSSVKDVVVATPSVRARPVRRRAFEAVSPIILVERPTPGETVTSPLLVEGTSNTFEANLQLELTDADGKVLAKRFLTATSGTGTRGTFSGPLEFAQPAAGTGLFLLAFENSAENGERVNIIKIPLVAG
jgi:hypothetical protein